MAIVTSDDSCNGDDYVAGCAAADGGDGADRDCDRGDRGDDGGDVDCVDGGGDCDCDDDVCAYDEHAADGDNDDAASHACDFKYAVRRRSW